MVFAIRGLLLAEAAKNYSDSEARACMVSSDCFLSQPGSSLLSLLLAKQNRVVTVYNCSVLP